MTDFEAQLVLDEALAIWLNLPESERIRREEILVPVPSPLFGDSSAGSPVPGKFHESVSVRVMLAQCVYSAIQQVKPLREENKRLVEKVARLERELSAAFERCTRAINAQSRAENELDDLVSTIDCSRRRRAKKVSGGPPALKDEGDSPVSDTVQEESYHAH